MLKWLIFAVFLLHSSVAQECSFSGKRHVLGGDSIEILTYDMTQYQDFRLRFSSDSRILVYTFMNEESATNYRQWRKSYYSPAYSCNTSTTCCDKIVHSSIFTESKLYVGVKCSNYIAPCIVYDDSAHHSVSLYNIYFIFGIVICLTPVVILITIIVNCYRDMKAAIERRDYKRIQTNVQIL